MKEEIDEKDIEVHVLVANRGKYRSLLIYYPKLDSSTMVEILGKLGVLTTKNLERKTE